ncbi:MAG TPA: tRNA pseudouridine(55) synthase TruB [Papillibacter sp.]|jgi:tRNA pseudouridine55 synthase|nr:tRNA pseudouridine(55) synthase TruB [Papillibacter sp.]
MNGILIIDKPSDWTSHDVVAKLRGLLRIRRIGHGGTLDPMATGVLPVFIGRATRAVMFCEDYDKSYTARLALGIETDTQDTTGNILTERDAAHIAFSDIEALLPRFSGEILQIPPMYSAIKIGGKKLYELARRGIETERPARPVTIHALSLRQDDSGFILDVTCSKGTYIRTLCHDIGQALGCGAAMSALRRTRVGPFTLGDAVSLHTVENAVKSGDVEGLIRPVDTLFSAYPAITVNEAQKKRCLAGAAFPIKAEEGLYRVYDAGQGFLMLGRVENGAMKTVRSFFEA